MFFEVLQEAHFDACTAFHDLGYRIAEIEAAALGNRDIHYEERNKGNEPKMWYSVMGECEVTDRVIADERFSVSRIDIAFDVLLSEEDIEYIYSNEGRDFPVKYMRHTKYFSSNGRTVYFGSGDKLLRIYEKGKQLGMAQYSNWVRFEFQLKGRIARQALEFSSSPQELFESLQAKYLYNDFSVANSAGQIEFVRPEKDRLEFWHKVVAPYMANNFNEMELAALMRPVFSSIRERARTKRTLKEKGLLANND